MKDSMSDGLAAIFWGVITFSILIVIHEGGHFLTARMFGVKVHEFMIGLPGPAIRFHARKTTYGITMVPLGGYVRIAGMEPGPEDPRLAEALATITRLGEADADSLSLALGIDEAEADSLLVTLADWDAIQPVEGRRGVYRSRFDESRSTNPKGLLDEARTVTYRALSTWKRVIVLSAGVVLNLLVAVLVFTVVVTSFGYYSTRVSRITPDSAAVAAGIAKGDIIERIDGKRATSWDKLVSLVGEREPGQRVRIQYERDGRDFETTVRLGKNPESGRGFLGVAPSVEKPSPWKALLVSLGYIGMTFEAILRFFNPSTFSQSVSQSTSVIGVSYMAADAARTSALAYAALVAMVSLSLGVINIFPIPPLDGGKIAVEIVEKLRGRPLPRRFSLGLSAAGALLLFALIGYLMYSDVVHFIVR